jgi:hypothetical protein
MVAEDVARQCSELPGFDDAAREFWHALVDIAVDAGLAHIEAVAS